MKWGPEQDHEILIFILEHCDVKVPYQEIANHLGCTAKAVTHRIASLKKSVKEHRANGNANNSGNEDTAAVTPKKRTRGAGKGKTGKGAKKAKREVDSDGGGDHVDAVADEYAIDDMGADVGEI